MDRKPICYPFRVGIGMVDITPEVGVGLVGGTRPVPSVAVETPQYVKTIAITSGDKTVVIVTLDVLYFVTADDVITKASEDTGIPREYIIINTSHTHSGPNPNDLYDIWTPKVLESIHMALDDRIECAIGISKINESSSIHNRRKVIDGVAVNTWLLSEEQRDGRYPAAGSVDGDLFVLSFTKKDGKFKALLFNYSCHCCTAPDNGKVMISADYPGLVREMLNEKLGYEVDTLYLPGACGDVNSLHTRGVIAKSITEAIIKSLEDIKYCDNPELSAISVRTKINERDPGEYNEKWITKYWNDAHDFLRSMYNNKFYNKDINSGVDENKSYTAIFSGIKIGDDIAIVTNPMELFVEIGLAIKESSPFKYTIVSELTNGCLAYCPTKKGFDQGGYETLFGFHSKLDKSACDIVYNKSCEILKKLKNK